MPPTSRMYLLFSGLRTARSAGWQLRYGVEHANNYVPADTQGHPPCS